MRQHDIGPSRPSAYLNGNQSGLELTGTGQQLYRGLEDALKAKCPAMCPNGSIT
jgi:hypothetical protein